MSPVALRAAQWIPVAVVVAVAMDYWAALLHRAVWHHRLWSVHRSHHVERTQRAQRAGTFERNDALSILHAPLAIAFILYGCAGPSGALRELVFGGGIGMTAFGVAYVIVHDGLVHARLPVRFLLRVRYLRRVAAAHRRHHATAPAGAPYGLFSGPSELRKATRVRRRTCAPSGPPRSTTPARAPSDRPPRGQGSA